jgi:hypothetical protein
LNDKVPDHRQRALRIVGNDTMAAVGKSLEADDVGRQCRGDVQLAFNWKHGVIFAAHDENGAFD